MIRFIVIFFSATIILFACNNSANNETKADTTVSIDKGKQIFKTHCVACHGADGTLGLNGAFNLSESKLSKEEKIQVITEGRKTMLSYKAILQPHEIQSVALYIESFADTVSTAP
jgi:cytochrome c6